MISAAVHYSNLSLPGWAQVPWTPQATIYPLRVPWKHVTSVPASNDAELTESLMLPWMSQHILINSQWASDQVRRLQKADIGIELHQIYQDVISNWGKKGGDIINIINTKEPTVWLNVDHLPTLGASSSVYYAVIGNLQGDKHSWMLFLLSDSPSSLSQPRKFCCLWSSIGLGLFCSTAPQKNI